MEDNTKSQCHSINGCFQLNINININQNKDDCVSVPENSNGNENIQININKNSNGFQQSFSLRNITKSFSDSSQQTDDAKNKLNKKNHKSVELSVDLTGLDEIGKQSQRNIENKWNSEDKTNNNNQVDKNNKTIDDSFPSNNQFIVDIQENSEKQKQCKESQMENIESTEDNNMIKQNDFEKKEIDLKALIELLFSRSCEQFGDNVENTDVQSDSDNCKSFSEPKCYSKNNESLGNTIDGNIKKDNMNHIDEMKSQIEDIKCQSGCFNKSETCENVIENKNQSAPITDHINDKKEQFPSQINENEFKENVNENENQSAPITDHINDKEEQLQFEINENVALNESNIDIETFMRNLLEDIIETVLCKKQSQQDAFDLLSPLINKNKELIHKEQLKPGGLHNSHSTCYMNAMIQALSSSDILVNTLANLTKSHSNSSLSLLYELLNGLNEPNINNETVMRNTNLLEDLMRSVGWTKPSQQDAFDLLSALICDIFEKSNDKEEIEIPLRIKLLHEFQGIKIPNKIQDYLGLSINLCKYDYPSGVLLQFLINQHFVSSTIDEDKSKLTRLSLYREIPNVLLIHIPANKCDPIRGEMIKPIYYIQYDENMTLWFDIANEINRENRNLNEDRCLGTQVEYHLRSIVHHAGNISGGHYVAHKKWRNQWYTANDESIIMEPLDTSISPYILIYEISSQD